MAINGSMLASAPVSSFRVMLPCGVQRVDSHAEGFISPSILMGSISHCLMYLTLGP